MEWVHILVHVLGSGERALVSFRVVFWYIFLPCVQLIHMLHTQGVGNLSGGVQAADKSSREDDQVRAGLLEYLYWACCVECCWVCALACTGVLLLQLAGCLLGARV